MNRFFRISALFSCLCLNGTALVFAHVASFVATAPAVAPKTEKSIEINRAAKVVLADGDVAAYSADEVKRVLKVGDTISERDNVLTGKDGELHLDMEDGGFVSVRPNTNMRIVKYQADGVASDSAVFSLLFTSCMRLEMQVEGRSIGPTCAQNDD